MTDPLEGCRAKLIRGEEHLDALDAEVRRFETSKPYRIRSETNTKRAERLYGVQVTKSPSPDWPGVLGDCIHNFRCTLDHLAWRLVEQHGSPNDSTQFPIYTRRKRFRKGWGSKIGKVRRKGLKTAFDGLQPYKGRPELYPLWILHRLDIIDKHRELLPTAMPRSPLLDIKSPLGSPVTYERGPFENSADVLRVRVPFGPNGPVDVDIDPFVQVLIADVEVVPGTSESLPLRETLRDIRDVTRRAIADLGGFCD
jgi:hypothetical protein